MATHPRTAMLDLLEELRLVVKHRDPAVTPAQVLAVLATLADDYASEAWQMLTVQPTNE